MSAPVTTDSKTMELLGLLVNELITNCFKHAFEGKDAGTIKVDVSKQYEKFVLTVTDDGNGMNDAMQGSYGMKLIRGFSHQLGGKPSFHNDHGTQFTLVFIPENS